MPDGNEVRIVGADEAARDMRAWCDQVGPTVDAASRGFAGTVAARVHPPVLTGALAASVGLLETIEPGQGIQEGAGLDYAGWIEFGGSRGRPAIPEGRYLYPTARSAENEFYALAETTAEQSVGRFPWSTPAA